MKFLNKVIACILCFTLILNLSTIAYGTESVNSPDEIHSYTVKVTSNEYSEPSVTFYEFEGKYYLALDDIKDFTRCTLTEDTETIMLTHGLRELVINKSTGQMVDSGMVEQGNISLLNYNGMYLCEGIPMLQYLGATCSIRNENIEILMPSFTIWESIMPDYLDYYFNINELYGGEDNVKISLILDIIADVLDGVSGHGLMANADMHLEDALYEILNVDMMKYVTAQDAATTLNQKINVFLSSAAFSTALDTGDNTYDAVYEALDYYVKFYVSGKNDILLDMMTQTDNLEYASDLASQIQKQVYSQSVAKANLQSAKTAQSFMDVGMLAFDTAITSYSMMQYDEDTRNLFARTINQEMFEYADYYDITWNNVSDKISNTLKSTQSIVANTAIENVAEFAVKKVTEEGAKSALSAFTAKANIYAAAVQIGFFVASLINYESNQAFSADMNAIWLSAVQYDIAMLTSSLLVKERDEFHFSSAESLEKLKDMFTLYYRTTIAFSENIAKSIEEFGSKSDQKWVEWFSSTTENSVANYAAEYLYRITNCTIVPIVDYSTCEDTVITADWIITYKADSNFLTHITSPSQNAISISTPAELFEKIQSNPAGEFRLTCDLDLSTYNNGEWVPIGRADYNSFTGTLDGQGHVIRNLKITDCDFAGLFYKIDGGTIKNLGIEATLIAGTEYAGGMAAIGSGTIFNSYIICPEISSPKYAGGVLGSNFSDGTNFEYVAVKANVTALVKPEYILNGMCVYGASGGLVGNSSATVDAQNIVFEGQVLCKQFGEAKSGSLSAGGIIGQSGDAKLIQIQDATISGKISTITTSGSKETTKAGSILCRGPGGYAGGIIGDENHYYGSGNFTYDNSILLNKCTVNADVCVNSYNAAYAGGMIASTFGLNGSDYVLIISECEYLGNVQAITDETVGSITYAGGLIGSCSSSTSIRNISIDANILAKNGIHCAYAGTIAARGNDQIVVEEITNNASAMAENASGKSYVNEIEQ